LTIFLLEFGLTCKGRVVLLVYNFTQAELQKYKTKGRFSIKIEFLFLFHEIIKQFKSFYYYYPWG